MKIETGSRLVTLVVALLSVFSVATLIVAERSVEQRRQAQQTHFETARAIAQLASDSAELTNAARYFAASGDERYRERFLAQIEIATRDNAIDRLHALLGDESVERGLIDEAKRNSDALIALEQRAVQLAENGARSAAVDLLLGPEFRAREVVAKTPLELAAELLETHQTATVGRLSARADWAATIAWATMTANVLAMLFVLLGFYRRRVVRPLVHITQQLKQMLAGKRNVQFITHHTAGQAIEIAELARTLDHYQKLAIEHDAQSEQLRLANAEQQAIFDSATSGIAFIKNRIIERANRKLHEIFGWPPGAIVGQSTSIWNTDEASWAASERTLYEPVWRGETSHHDEPWVRRDGSRIWTRIAGRAVDVGDPSKGSVWIFDDITAEHEAIDELRKARALAEEAMRAKSDFLANMSHEIRTPMNAIIGMAYLALKADPPPPQRQRDYLKKIQTSGHLLLGIINDILDLSKIDAGKMSVERVDFDLEQVLNSVTTLIAEKAASKGLELIIDVADDVPARLLGDPLRLGQVLVNYANNAVKFTEQGEIEICVALVQAVDDDVLLRFSVRDTGIGLSDEQCARLFKSFEQADSSTTRKFGGTGLGLVIAKRLAERMGGAVGVDSEVGRGSTFWFTARLGRSTAPARTLQARAELRGTRILVVDDSDTAREVIGDMLRGMSFGVSSVSSGAQAVAEVERAAHAGVPYAIVFLDWQMPQMDGIATATKIRELGLGEPPKLVMISAYGRDELYKLADAAGIVDVLIKPLNASQLFDTALGVLGTHLDEVAPAAADSPRESELASIAGARILLVEDNEMNQDVANELLTSAGFTVELAENGRVALDKLAQSKFALVLMDIQMPVMDGFEATREIRKSTDSRTLPIIAMTADAMPGDKEKCIAAGMQDHIAKPIDPDALWQALGRWIKHLPQATTAAPPASSATDGGFADDTELPRGIAGIDMAQGLKRVLGKKALYLSILRKFMARQANAPGEIVAALDAGDHRSAERLAHTLKGSAATLGANAIAEVAALLENSLRENEARTAIDVRVHEVAVRVTELIDALRAALPSETDSARPICVDPQHFKTLATRLAERLADNDSEASDLFRENADFFRAALGDRYPSIEQSIRNFDFEVALGTLQTAMSEMATTARPADQP